MNKVILIGRTTKEIELRSTKNGKSVASFYLAVPKIGKDKETDFVPCVAWDKTAELLEKYVSKGDKIAVYGRINTRNYEDKNKQKVYVTEVVVEELHFLENKEKSAQTDDDDDYPF